MWIHMYAIAKILLPRYLEAAGRWTASFTYCRPSNAGCRYCCFILFAEGGESSLRSQLYCRLEINFISRENPPHENKMFSDPQMRYDARRCNGHREKHARTHKGSRPACFPHGVCMFGVWIQRLLSHLCLVGYCFSTTNTQRQVPGTQ